MTTEDETPTEAAQPNEPSRPALEELFRDSTIYGGGSASVSSLVSSLYKQPAIDPAAIRARVHKTTDGPWIQEWHHGTIMLPGTIGEPMGKESTRADLEFIGHARSDVPALLDVIDVLARLLLNPTYEIEFNEERVLTYRPEEVIEAMKTLGLNTEEKRAEARVKLSWQGGGSLR